MRRAVLILTAGISLASAAPPKIAINEDDVVEINGRRYIAIDALGESVVIQSKDANPTPRRAVATAQAVTIVEQAHEPIYGTLTWNPGLFKGTPPDFGGKIWLVKEEEITGLAKEAGGTATEPIPTNATGWPAKLDAMFPKTVADGNGKFAFTNISPGNYLIIYLSKRANGLAARDRGGKMRFKSITVEDGKPVDASFDFGVTAY